MYALSHCPDGCQASQRGALLGKDKITPESPEYLGINSALKYTAYKYDQKMADDILDIYYDSWHLHSN